MADTTALDRAHARMDTAPDNDGARLRFYEHLAASELFVLLVHEASGRDVTPEIFELSGRRYVLVFDREDRLAQFTARAAPYAALSGRAVAKMLSAQGLGLALNLEVAPSSILIPPEAVAWLADILRHDPQEIEAQIDAFHAPKGLPETLLTALDARLASAAGLADLAYLTGVTYATGAHGHLLGFVDARAGAEAALAQTAAETLAFSGLDAAALDVGFFKGSDPVAARMAKVGLRFDLPRPPAGGPMPGVAPGTDPEKPPRLR